MATQRLDLEINVKGNAAAGLSKMGAKFTRTLTSITKVVGVATVAVGALALKLGKDAALNMDKAAFFYSKFGKTAKAGLKELEKAAKGTVPTMDLIAASNRAALLGVTNSLKDLSGLMTTARLRGKAMGLSVTQAFDDIVTGIGRGSPLILDNLGIKVPEALKKSMESMTDAQKTMALTNFAIKDGAMLAKQLGGDTLTAADRYARFTAMVANLKQKFGELINTALIPLVEAIMPDLERGYQTLMKRTEEWGIKTAEKLKSVKQNWNDFKIGVTDSNRQLSASVNEYGDQIINGALKNLQKELGITSNANMNLSQNIGMAWGYITGVVKLAGKILVAAFLEMVRWVVVLTKSIDTNVKSWGALWERVKANMALFKDAGKNIQLAFDKIFGEGTYKKIDRILSIITRVIAAIGTLGISELIRGSSKSASGLAKVFGGGMHGGVVKGFATGGIVPGQSMGGDNVLARVNSGEMVLNRAQQSKLFNMIGESSGSRSNITFNVNIPMYTGDPQSKRKVAEDMWKELSRVATAKGIKLEKLF